MMSFEGLTQEDKVHELLVHVVFRIIRQSLSDFPSNRLTTQTRNIRNRFQCNISPAGQSAFLPQNPIGQIIEITDRSGGPKIMMDPISAISGKIYHMFPAKTSRIP
jgi:hypothetical protein